MTITLDEIFAGVTKPAAKVTTKRLDTWEKAKAESLVRCKAEVESALKETIDSKGRSVIPATRWIRKSGAGDILVHWRIANKAVRFAAGNVDESGNASVKNVKEAKAYLERLAQGVEAGLFDREIQEAFDRKPAKKTIKAAME